MRSVSLIFLACALPLTVKNGLFEYVGKKLLHRHSHKFNYNLTVCYKLNEKNKKYNTMKDLAIEAAQLLALCLTTTAVPSSNPGGVVLLMDKVRVFEIFVGVLPFPHFHFINTLHFLTPFPI